MRKSRTTWRKGEPPPKRFAAPLLSLSLFLSLSACQRPDVPQRAKPVKIREPAAGGETKGELKEECAGERRMERERERSTRLMRGALRK